MASMVDVHNSSTITIPPLANPDTIKGDIRAIIKTTTADPDTTMIVVDAETIASNTKTLATKTKATTIMARKMSTKAADIRKYKIIKMTSIRQEKLVDMHPKKIA